MYLATKLVHSNDDDSSSKTILDADSKKVIQHHFKLKNTCMEICELCGECVGKETFSVTIKVRPCTMTRQGQSVSWKSCKICL